MSGLRVESMVLGLVETNTYLLMDEETGALAVIDPAARAEDIARKADEMNGKPCMILLTHGHFDHIGAVDALRRAWNVPCLCLDAEASLLEDPGLNASALFGCPTKTSADRLLKDGEEILLGSHPVRVIATPGHTVGGCCYYLPEDGLLFCGDTLFDGSVGRTDLPTGDMSALMKSIRERLAVLPDETGVFPGHGDATDIGEQKSVNPYLSMGDL